MQCPKCSASVEPSKAFCQKCGHRIAPLTQKTSTETSSTHNKPAKSTGYQSQVTIREVEPGWSKKKIGWWTSLGLALGALLWWIMGSLPVVGDFPLADAWSKPAEVQDLVPATADWVAQINWDTQDVEFNSLISHSQQSILSLLAADEAQASSELWTKLEPVVSKQITFALDFEPQANTEQSPESAWLVVFSIKDVIQSSLFWEEILSQSDLQAKTQIYQGQDIIKLSVSSSTPVLVDENSLSPTKIEADQENQITTFWLNVDDRFLVSSNSEFFIQKSIDTMKDDFASFFASQSVVDLPMVDLEDGGGQLWLDFRSFDWGRDMTSPPWWVSFALADINLFLWQIIGGQTEAPLVEAEYKAQYLRSQGLWSARLLADQEPLKKFSWSSGSKPVMQEPLGLKASLFTPSLADDVADSVVIYGEVASLQELLETTIFNNQFALGQLVERGIVSSLQDETWQIDIKKDFLSWLDQPAAIGLWSGQKYPTLNLVVAVEDFQAVEPVLQKLIIYLEALTQGEEALPQNPTQVQEAQARFKSQAEGAYTVVWYETDSSLAGSLLSYSYIDGNLVVSSDPEGLKSFIAVAEGRQANLLSNERFTKHFKSVPDKVTLLSYVDVPAFLALLQPAAQEDQTVKESFWLKWSSGFNEVLWWRGLDQEGFWQGEILYDLAI